MKCGLVSEFRSADLYPWNCAALLFRSTRPRRARPATRLQFLQDTTGGLTLVRIRDGSSDPPVHSKGVVPPVRTQVEVGGGELGAVNVDIVAPDSSRAFEILQRPVGIPEARLDLSRLV